MEAPEGVSICGATCATYTRVTCIFSFTSLRNKGEKKRREYIFIYLSYIYLYIYALFTSFTRPLYRTHTTCLAGTFYFFFGAMYADERRRTDNIGVAYSVRDDSIA